MLYLSGKTKKLDLISLVLIVGSVVICITLVKSYYEGSISQYKSETELYKQSLDRLKFKISMPRYPFATNYERKDYHNLDFMELEASRVGPGENGAKFVVTDAEDFGKNKEFLKTFGMFAGLSDIISVNRSVPDVRLPSCRHKAYLQQLSKVSIVIVFFDEYFSVLLRTIHSIYNRTPRELLHEIILINDNSTMNELYEPLEDYVKQNFNGIVKIFVQNERRGLVIGRLEGAKIAKGEVLVFLDSQVEVNVNWLPPLLEPIALTPRVVTTPIIDSIVYDTFEYRKSDDGGRGMLNWDLFYRRFPRRAEDSLKLDEPIPSPIMVGTAFAINRQNFWDLGGYDDGLKVFQGENLELSFKAHLCGGGLVECPCSRIAHHRNINFKRFGDDGVDYMIRNFKRIAEVWLDDYKEVVYQRNKQRYTKADVGDLVRAKQIKMGLHCKPFSYFLEFVAPEMLERYPLVDPGLFAQGVIQSKANPELCVEAPKTGKARKITLESCEKNLVQPSVKQFFKLSWHRNIQHFIYDYCLQDSLTMAECHFKGGNQFWKYDLSTNQLLRPSLNNSQCLTFDSVTHAATMEVCDESDINQKWNWGEKNLTALQSWESFGVNLTTLRL